MRLLSPSQALIYDDDDDDGDEDGRASGAWRAKPVSLSERRDSAMISWTVKHAVTAAEAWGGSQLSLRGCTYKLVA